MKRYVETPFFPYGTQYYRAPTPLPEEWEEDLREIARCRYTHVQFRPQWRWHERIRGKYCWDDLDRLCDLAHKNGLRVIIKSMLETAPDWVFQELGGLRIGFHHRPIEPISHAAFYVGGWLPCFDNPQVRQAAFEFNRRLAERYKDHPALWFFNAWNEPRSRPLGECHCPHSVASYRRWLAERFGTIEALNDAYGKAWSSFDTVQPPESASDFAEMHLWRQWAEQSVADRVRVSYEGLKAGAPERIVMCHVGASSVVQDPACDTSNDLLNAAQVDFYGCSFPVALHPSGWNDEASPLYQGAWMRRVDPKFWIQEFYPNYAMWCKTPDPAKLHQILLMSLAVGCHGFTFWQYRSERFGEESNGWGMREIDGSPTVRSCVCDTVAETVARLGERLHKTATVRSPVACLYSRGDDLLARIQTLLYDEPGSLDTNVPFRPAESPARRAQINAFTLFRLNGFNADFVTPGDDFSPYKLLHVNAVGSMDEALAGQLCDYAAQGGTLFIEYPFACRESNTWVAKHRPMCGLEKLTGCREGLRQVIASGENTGIRWRDGATADGGGWRVGLMDCRDDEIAAEWADFPGAAVVIHPYGKGLVITSGANFSLGWNGTAEDGSFRAFRRVLQHADLIPGENPACWEMVRSGEGGSFRFIFNVGAAPFTVELEPGETEVYSTRYAPEERRLDHYGSVVLYRES